ncbi:MAG: hypothetical protein JNK67_25150 [Alphaproteobacteria bacterium]|nr:hypothetical protein [Alphaproteobacteria bacterium]
MKAEADLYAPVKAFLERLGYDVKGEIRGCDVVGTRGQEPPVIVELKRAFGLGLVLQGIDRLALSEVVYLGVGAWPNRLKDVRKLCRRVGLGLLVVVHGRVEVVTDPEPYAPRRNAKRLKRLLGEHARRAGDPNRGGTTRIPIMTAYRQEALRCAELLALHGPLALARLREAGDVPNAARILQQDVYGWFERVSRGTYAVTDGGRAGLERFGYGGADGRIGRAASEDAKPQG